MYAYGDVAVGAVRGAARADVADVAADVALAERFLGLIWVDARLWLDVRVRIPLWEHGHAQLVEGSDREGVERRGCVLSIDVDPRVGGGADAHVRRAIGVRERSLAWVSRVDVHRTLVSGRRRHAGEGAGLAGERRAGRAGSGVGPGAEGVGREAEEVLARACGSQRSHEQSNTVTPLEETAGAVRLGCEVVTVVEASDGDGGCRGVGKLDGEVDVGERVL
jgi:hypothetical protein